MPQYAQHHMLNPMQLQGILATQGQKPDYYLHTRPARDFVDFNTILEKENARNMVLSINGVHFELDPVQL